MRLFELKIPVLGICYGMQLACQMLGSTVTQTPAREYGRARLAINDSRDLLKGIRAKVNLIPFNEAEELNYRRPSDAVIERFQQILIDHHISAFVRRNRGNDISAACGQLKKKWAV